jgi:hypothetical protein
MTGPSSTTPPRPIHSGIVASSAAAPCPAANDSTTLVLGGKVYRFVGADATYVQAKSKCAALDSYPIVLNTWREQLEVENYFDYRKQMWGYWIGLRQPGDSSVW